MPGTTTCHTAGCSEPLEQPPGRGRRKEYCTDCCEIRKYGAAIRRILARRPELHAEAQAQLGASGPRPRRPNGSPRPDWRNRRREAYVPYELWTCVEIVATQIVEERVSLSAALRYIIRAFWETVAYDRSLFNDLRVEDGEIIGWSDEKEAQGEQSK